MGDRAPSGGIDRPNRLAADSGQRAEGLGDGSTLDCLAGKYEKLNGKAPWKRVTGACETTLEVDDGDAKGFVVGRDMVVRRC